jgi:hypothetical protein
MDVMSAAAPPRRLSRLLLDIADAGTGRISLADLATAVGDRSFAALMIIFSAPNLVPLPPGGSTVFGIPLLVVAAQLLAGMPRIWLPGFIAKRSIDRRTFALVARRIAPVLQRFEAVARPRFWPRSRAIADRWVGLVVFTMAVVLILPIPLGNWLPAVTVILASLGLVERDGLWVAAGSLCALASFAFIAAVLLSIGVVAGVLFG